MKAISAMIAVVLLIGFTVAIGGILSAWFSSLTTSQTTTIGSSTDKQTKCAGTSITVSEVRYPSGSGASAFVNVTVRYDIGTEGMSNVTAEVAARGSVQSNTSNSTFSPGEVRVIQVSPANYPPELVSVRALCQSSIPIIGTCVAGQPCMKPAS